MRFAMEPLAHDYVVNPEMSDSEPQGFHCGTPFGRSLESNISFSVWRYACTGLLYVSLSAITYPIYSKRRTYSARLYRGVITSGH